MRDDIGEITNRVLNYFHNQGNYVAESDALFQVGAIDSLGLLEMVSFLEEEFDVVLDQDVMTLENFETVTRIATTVSQARHGNS